MNMELMEALNILEKEKDISKDALLGAIEQSLLLACKNHFGKADNVSVNINPDTCDFKVYAEKTVVESNGQPDQFDAMWISSLCDSTAKGKPDIELVDMSSRIRTIDDVMDVTTKPIILDGDTGGLVEHFVYNVRTLERMGVSAVIIEDKTGLKKNSLFEIGRAHV